MSMSGPGCAVMCNLINTHIHTRRGSRVMRKNRPCNDRDEEEAAGESLGRKRKRRESFSRCRVLSEDVVTVVAITDPP